MVFIWLLLFTFAIAAISGSVMLIMGGGWFAILAGILIFMGNVIETIWLLGFIFGKMEEQKRMKMFLEKSKEEKK